MIDCIAAASSPAAPPEAAPLWHIAMLNDSSRNSLYRRSIAHAFEKLGCRSIMDIGCGSGLLAAYALQTGYSKVYGCEVDKNLYEIAKNLVPQFKKNEDSELILVNEYSEDIIIDDHLGSNFEKLDALVFEIFDDSFFGERILPVLKDAIERFLKPNGVLIPHKTSIEFHMCQINSIKFQQSLAIDSRELSIAPIVFNNRLQNYERFYTLAKIDLESDKILHRTQTNELSEFDLQDANLIDKIFQGHPINLHFESQPPNNGAGMPLPNCIRVGFKLKFCTDEWLCCSQVIDQSSDNCEHRSQCWQSAIFPIYQPHVLEILKCQNEVDLQFIVLDSIAQFRVLIDGKSNDIYLNSNMTYLPPNIFDSLDTCDFLHLDLQSIENLINVNNLLIITNSISFLQSMFKNNYSNLCKHLNNCQLLIYLPFMSTICCKPYLQMFYDYFNSLFDKKPQYLSNIIFLDDIGTIDSDDGVQNVVVDPKLITLEDTRNKYQNGKWNSLLHSLNKLSLDIRRVSGICLNIYPNYYAIVYQMFDCSEKLYEKVYMQEIADDVVQNSSVQILTSHFKNEGRIFEFKPLENCGNLKNITPSKVLTRKSIQELNRLDIDKMIDLNFPSAKYPTSIIYTIMPCQQDQIFSSSTSITSGTVKIFPK